MAPSIKPLAKPRTNISCGTASEDLQNAMVPDEYFRKLILAQPRTETVADLPAGFTASPDWPNISRSITRVMSGHVVAQRVFGFSSGERVTQVSTEVILSGIGGLISVSPSFVALTAMAEKRVGTRAFVQLLLETPIIVLREFLYPEHVGFLASSPEHFTEFLEIVRLLKYSAKAAIIVDLSDTQNSTLAALPALVEGSYGRAMAELLLADIRTF